jgi:hypothetical protein
LAAAVPVWTMTHAEVDRGLTEIEPNLLRRGLNKLS